MKVLYVENILHVNNFLPKKLEPYLAFLWEKLHVHYVNKKSRAVSTFMLMIFNVMQPKLEQNAKMKKNIVSTSMPHLEMLLFNKSVIDQNNQYSTNILIRILMLVYFIYKLQ